MSAVVFACLRREDKDINLKANL